MRVAVVRQGLLGLVAALSVTPLALAQEPSALAEPADLPPPPPPVEPWYDALEMRAFADAYASLNYNFPKPADSINPFRAYDTHNGFALAWVGLDLAYAPDPVGGVLQLRFGPSAARHGASDTEHELHYVKQAFASFRPGGPESGLILDFGKFDTIYGIEVADSQDNFNYTRGLLFWLAQPLFHTGLRASYAFSDHVALRALAVNGWNNSVDNNSGKSFGLQIDYQPTERFAARLGWLGGPEQSDTTSLACGAGESYDPNAEGCAPDPTAIDPAEYVVDRGGANEFDAWRHLIDLAVTFNPTPQLGLALNVDYGWERQRDTIDPSQYQDVSWYGGMLAARYQFTSLLALAGRAEYVRDVDGFLTATEDLGLASGTLTLEATPTPSLILRLEQRADFALGAGGSEQREVFQREIRETSSNQLTTTLGVVVTTP